MGGGGTRAAAFVRGVSGGGFVGGGLPQVAERALRLWARVRAGAVAFAAGDGAERFGVSAIRRSIREPANYTPEASRRARGVEIWAALRSLGRSGLAEMVERSCELAGRFADGLSRAGFQVLNDVVLNQVLVSFGDAAETRRVIAEVQRDGTCWCGGTEWQGHTAMRVSVSCYQTTEEDIDRSVAAVVRIARVDQDLRSCLEIGIDVGILL